MNQASSAGLKSGPADFLHADRSTPGASASTVHPSAWWNSCFRVSKSVGGTFPSFIRPFHRKPAKLLDEAVTAALWPMPLPYPSVLFSESSSVEKDFSYKRGLNLIVAALNWLHLRRPAVCPLEICLFQKLSKVQWKVVKQLEACMVAWQVCEPIDAAAMGRTSSKVEDLERLLGRLQVFETQAFDPEFGLLQESSGGLNSPKKSGFYAPGLQPSSAGEVCGSLLHGAHVVAKPIVSDRLEFRGRPDFDAKPFLDARGQRIYRTPVDTEVWKLLRKLDDSGRLGLLKEEDIFPGYQAGLFSVQKDASKDRLIFDSRPWTCWRNRLGGG